MGDVDDRLFILPQAEQTYLANLTAKVHDVLDSSLLGLYVFGSISTSSYILSISDIDVQAVISSCLPSSTYKDLARALSHTTLPCPATKLEFVLYTRDEVAQTDHGPHYELNLNTGRTFVEDFVSLNWKTDHLFWFVLDISMGQRTGIPLFGPPASTLFSSPSQDLVLQSLRESIEWHAAYSTSGANSVLNVCRSWLWLVENRWASKAEGTKWALQQEEAQDWWEMIAAADGNRRGDVNVDESAARSFLSFIAVKLQAKSAN